MSTNRWLATILQMSRDELEHELSRNINPAQRKILERLINNNG